MKGTVFFRPSKSAKADGKAKKHGTWTYAFSVPKADGRRRQITKGGFPTKKACEDALNLALVDFGQAPGGVVMEPSKQLLGDFLQDWLDGRTDIKSSTRSVYQHVITSWIIPFAGEVRLCNLTPAHITRMYRTLRASGAKTKSGKPAERAQTQPLSERSVHKVHVVLTAALGYAARTGAVRVNPMTLIDKRDRPKQNGSDRPEMKTWSSEEAALFLERTFHDRWAPIYDIGLNTGMRRGELAGLRWTDVELDNANIRVRNNRVSVDYVVHEGTTKSSKARPVDIDAATVAVLRRWRARQLEERLAAGDAWTDSGYVFTDELGAALHPGTINWHLKRLTKAAGVPTIRLHDLRHTHATLGLAAGVPLKVMSERLGHASTQITADLYQHVIPGMGAEAAAKIGGLLRRAN